MVLMDTLYKLCTIATLRKRTSIVQSLSVLSISVGEEAQVEFSITDKAHVATRLYVSYVSSSVVFTNQYPFLKHLRTFVQKIGDVSSSTAYA